MPSALPDQKPSAHRAAPLPDSEWERVKPVIQDEYKARTLNDLMTLMETKHHFKATKQQYKGKLRRWKFDKYIKREEMNRLVQNAFPEWASNGKEITKTQKQRYRRQRNGQSASEGGTMSPTSTTESSEMDTLSSSDGMGLLADNLVSMPDHTTLHLSGSNPHHQPVQIPQSQRELLFMTGGMEDLYGPVGVALPSGFNPILSNWYSGLYLGFDMIKQESEFEIAVIKRVDVKRWTTLHLAVLWRLVVEVWPPAISHSRYPLDSNSWRWYFDAALKPEDVAQYMQVVPNSFTGHHAIILAALFTVRYWNKAGVDSVSSRSQCKSFCIAVAFLAIRRAISCLHDELQTVSLFDGDYAQESLQGLSSDEDCAIVQSEMMQTIKCDLTANKFALWESDIFHFVDYLYRRMVDTAALRSPEACDVLQKYLPRPVFTGVVGAPDQYSSAPMPVPLLSQDHLVADLGSQDVMLA